MRDHRFTPAGDDLAAYVRRELRPKVDITKPMRRQGPKIQLSDERKRKRKRKAAQASRRGNR